MGEMADYTNSGDLTWGHFAAQTTCCAYCGRPRLHWERTERGWRLFDRRGRIHSCDEYTKVKGRSG